MCNYCYFFYIFLLIAICTDILNAVQVVFKDNTAYTAQLVNESERTITISYKGSQYRIPKSHLESFDLAVKGPDDGYYYMNWELSDGSKIRGYIVEQRKSDVILKTKIGLLTIEKNNLTTKIPQNQSDFHIPDSYLLQRQDTPKTVVGLGIPFLLHSQPWHNENLGLTGGTLFIEPDSLELRGVQFGLKLSTLRSIPNSNAVINSVLPYINVKFYRIDVFSMDFYLDLGYGVSHAYFANSREQGNNLSGYVPVSYSAFGIHKVIYNDYIFRPQDRNRASQ